MIKDLCEYVCLDGVYVKEDSVVKMAGNAGSFAVAEHYLCALLAHGLMYGKADIINKVNEVRAQYQVLPYAKPEDQAPRDEYGRSRVESVESKVRKLYSQMTIEERRKLLRSSLSLLRTNHHLFMYARHWLGVFLVIRDRLEGDSLKMKDFIDYANDIMPLDWPITLKMGLNTYKNFSREIGCNDKGEAYYDMENCPQKELCDTLWDIIKQMILTIV